MNKYELNIVSKIAAYCVTNEYEIDSINVSVNAEGVTITLDSKEYKIYSSVNIEDSRKWAMDGRKNWRSIHDAINQFIYELHQARNNRRNEIFEEIAATTSYVMDYSDGLAGSLGLAFTRHFIDPDDQYRYEMALKEEGFEVEESKPDPDYFDNTEIIKMIRANPDLDLAFLLNEKPQ